MHITYAKIKDISNFGRVQRKTTRFVNQDNSNYNSSNNNELGWKHQKDTRRAIRLTMLYKIIYRNSKCNKITHTNTCRYQNWKQTWTYILHNDK